MGMFGILPFVRSYSYPRLEITSREDLRDYYGGFYPDEAWAASIRPIPRALRGNPQMRHRAWESAKGTPDDFHEKARPLRVYLHGEYMDALRVWYLTEAARILGLLYQDTGEEAYAERAAAILYGFGCAVPHWPKVHRGRPGVAEEDRLRPVADYSVYAGLWYDKYHTGIKYVGDLAQGYDMVANAPVWETLDRLAPGGDARATVESDLFLYSAKDALRYDVHYPHPESALSNYIPYQVMGLISIGRGAGVPELVHYACWKLRQMAQKTLMADAVFPESVSYAIQHIKGMSNAARLAEGYSDPPGFVSTVDGRRFDALDSARELPQLRRAIETLDTMLYPDGEYMTVHDT